MYPLMDGSDWDNAAWLQLRGAGVTVAELEGLAAAQQEWRRHSVHALVESANRRRRETWHQRAARELRELTAGVR
jgi:hypothetical protein